MPNDHDENDRHAINLPQPSSRDLRGRQSVRATFKLTTKAIEAMSAVSIHLGIKQKSLFDHLIEDVETLEVLAKEIQTEHPVGPSRVQKTFVLSRRTLGCLEQVARAFQAPRDALVEYSILRLMPVIEKEKEKHHARKKVLKNLNAFLASGHEFLDAARSTLGEEDPVFDEIEHALKVLKEVRDRVSAFVEKGKIIERF
jgi:hypothetical protein